MSNKCFRSMVTALIEVIQFHNGYVCTYINTKGHKADA